MRKVLVVGNAACVADDLERAGKYSTSDIISVNYAALLLLKPPAYCATVHIELANKFRRSGTKVITRKKSKGADIIWKSPSYKPKKVGDFIYPWCCGTSGLYAVGYALYKLGADEVVMAGCPIDPGPHIDDPRLLGGDLNAYRSAWEQLRGELKGRVRSMSGWSKRFLEGLND